MRFIESSHQRVGYRWNKIWKLRYLSTFSEAKTEEWDQKVSNFSGQYGITFPCSATYFLQVGAGVVLKVATKGSVRGKKLWKFRHLGPFSKGKTEESDKKLWTVFDAFGISIPSVAANFLEVGACVSLKLATKGSLRGKKLWRVRFLFCCFNTKREGFNEDI